MLEGQVRVSDQDGVLDGLDKKHGHRLGNPPTHYYLRRHLCSRVKELGKSCAASHQKLRDANRRNSGALECAQPG